MDLHSSRSDSRAIGGGRIKMTRCVGHRAGVPGRPFRGQICWFPTVGAATLRDNSGRDVFSSFAYFKEVFGLEI